MLRLAEREDLISYVYKGAEAFLDTVNDPQFSDAVEDLIQRSMEYSPENPPYVVVIGAITNIVSALLVCPEIADNIVVIWIGGDGK